MSFEPQSPINSLDGLILSTHSFLQNKYKSEISQILSLRIQNGILVAICEGTKTGRMIGREIWEKRESFRELGAGLKVVIGGKVLGHFPPIKKRGESMLQPSTTISMTDSDWLRRQIRGVYPNLQRVESLQRNDGTVYLVSACQGDNNVIKGVFPFLALEKVLSAPVAELVGKPVNYAANQRQSGDDDPALIGKIRARVVREGAAEGYYAEAYAFRWQSIQYKMEMEYLSLDCKDEALIITRNLDLFQKGYWQQIKESLS